MDVWTGRYSGQSALITGGAGDIGFATAERLAAEGAVVGIVDIRAPEAEAAAARLTEAGYRAYACPADITKPDEVKAAFDAFEARTGRIDVLANLAGSLSWVEFEEMTLERWRKIIAVNLDGTFVTCHDVMPRMIKRGYGRISTVSSGTVYLGLTNQSAYIAAKIGVVGYTRVLARQGGPHGITANTVTPTLTDTQQNIDLLGDRAEEAFAAVVKSQCVGRRGKPEDIAEGVAWVCSKAASFYTGQVLYMGGGDRFSM